MSSAVAGTDCQRRRRQHGVLAQQISINLQAVSSFAAFGQFVESANPSDAKASDFTLGRNWPGGHAVPR